MIIQIENIQKSYGRTPILMGVTFTAQAGQCIGILGKNGSGKSTLFSVLNGLQKGNGRFLCNGEDLLKNSKMRSALVGLVPQSPPLLQELSAKDNLRLWYSRTALDAAMNGGVLQLLGIPDFYTVPVSKMSGGMKKRLSIGCAVAHDPRILFLDEPSAALDLICKQKIADYLRAFKARGGIVLLATHDAYELELCDALYILKDGILQPYGGERSVDALVGCLE